jgi:hypothetical protein
VSSGLHLCALNCFWMADSAFPVLGSAENCALQYSQIPSAGTFLTRFTIRRLRFGIKHLVHVGRGLLASSVQLCCSNSTLIPSAKESVVPLALGLAINTRLHALH